MILAEHSAPATGLSYPVYHYRSPIVPGFSHQSQTERFSRSSSKIVQILSRFQKKDKEINEIGCAASALHVHELNDRIQPREVTQHAGIN